jgi:hypothetical protein
MNSPFGRCVFCIVPCVYLLAKEAMYAPLEGDSNIHPDLKSFLLDSRTSKDSKDLMIEAIKETTQTEEKGKGMFLVEAKNEDALIKFIESELPALYKKGFEYENGLDKKSPDDAISSINDRM